MKHDTIIISAIILLGIASMITGQTELGLALVSMVIGYTAHPVVKKLIYSKPQKSE